MSDIAVIELEDTHENIEVGRVLVDAALSKLSYGLEKVIVDFSQIVAFLPDNDDDEDVVVAAVTAALAAAGIEAHVYLENDREIEEPEEPEEDE